MAEGRRLFVLGREEPVPVAPKADVLEALEAAGVPIRTSCGGVATCGLCRVTVLAGGECLTALKGAEVHHLGNVAPIVGLRLACQARFAKDGEVRIEIPPIEDVQVRRRRKQERARGEAAETAEGTRGGRERRARVEWRPRVLAQAANVPQAEPAPGRKRP